MSRKLEGKVAVITGSGRGIGRGIAILSAKEGARVVVNDIFREGDGTSAADKVVQEIRGAGGTAVANYDSVASMAGGESIIRTAINNFGRIDILVNVAGNGQRKKNLEVDEAEWDSILAVHIKGHFACTKAAMSFMLPQKSGRIINFSSRGAFFSPSWAYGTAKAGILGFTSCLSRELKPHNITVNAILPSADTQLFPGDRVSVGDNMPHYARPGPDSVAPIVVYLASDAAKDVTGRFFYSSAGDICVYSQPFKLSAANAFIRKPGSDWTVDEIDEVIPSVLGIGQ